MKRILSLLAVAAVALGLAAQARAQFGILAGLTSSKVDMTGADVKNISLYHAGLTYKINLGAGFALQPSLLYQVKGASIGSLDTASDSDFKLKSGYVELPLGIQWGPDLSVFRPYVFAEPFIGYQVTSSDKADSFSSWTEQARNKFEYGYGLGGGLEIASHIQLSVQYFNNIGNLFQEGGNSSAASWSDRIKGFKGVKFTLGLLF